MQIQRVRSLQRGLDTIFKDAGQNLTWFKYSGSAAGLPEFGLGVTVTYYTSYMRGIVWQGQRFVAGAEFQQPGGASEQGQLQALTRERISEDDMVDFDSLRYRVAGAPIPHFQGSTLYYSIWLRRAE